MRFILPLSPSRHNRDADIREALKQAIVEQLGGEAPVKRLYKTTVILRGDWFKPNGEPRERDTNNVVVALFDVLVECFWGNKRRGIGDCWIDRDFSVHAEQDSFEQVEVTLE